MPLSTVERGRGRTKLWDLDEWIYCSLVGTCLTDQDLLALANRSDFPAKRTDPPYARHRAGVTACASRTGAAKRLQKILDERYRAAIRELSGAESRQALLVAWRDALCRDSVPGCYWAIVSHPLADSDLRRQIYGELHMLTHTSVLDLARERGRVRRLQSELDDLRQRFEAASGRAATLASRLDAAHQAGSLQPPVSLRPASASAEPTRLPAHQRARYQELIARLRAENRQLRRKLNQRIGAPEVLIKSLDPPTPACSLAGCCGSEPRAECALDQRCVLYVGGRRNQVDSLRKLVESRRGNFLHHDGGIEESAAQLDAALDRCDVVFCPVDCVSHNACNKLKRHCRQRDKRIIFLRSSGTSGFERALDSLGQQLSQ